MKTLVLVDGNALLHRAYHATPPLTTSRGELVNAVYGFTNMLLKSIQDLKPDYMAIAWDKKAPTFRHKEYTQYKATRGPADEGLSTQYERVHQVVRALNIPEFGLEGYEADDLIGTLAKQAMEEKDLEVIVLTGDRDIMQIIGERVRILMPKKTLADVGMYGRDEFFEKYGFEPLQIIEYKALAGDASDNIPGVAGIGDVTATKLIKEFGSIEEMYKMENLKTIPQRTQMLLAEGAESAALSKRLATLDLDSPIKLNLKECQMGEDDKNAQIALFEELEFKTLVQRLTGGASSSSDTLQPIQQASSKEAIDLDLAVTPVLEKMTKNGILVDLPFLENLGTELKEKLKTLEEGIFHHVGHEFNLNSPKQLSEVLFDDLKLPVIKRTKTGRSTDEGTLTELKDAHPMIPLFLQYRQLYKLVSTYVDALPKSIGEDGRIHSTFNVDGAATGRLSSINPNLQNIPVRGQTGGDIRRAFIAPKGKVLLGADYSQIELRILAHMADEPTLKDTFESDIDIHTATAAKIFKIPVEQVSKEQRTVGKTMNFATLYGQGPKALSKQLNIDFQIARIYIAEYFEQFPKIKDWMMTILEEGKKTGYVETIWGRRRYIPELISSNKMFQAAGERAAVNHPIQGTQADMIKKAMVDIGKELKKDSLMILQVHDELLFEVFPKDVDEVAKLVQEKMANALKLSVPVKVDLKTGPNWGEMTPFKQPSS